MQAITIEYKGPTNTKGSRMIAKAEAGSVTVPYDHSKDMEGNAIAAAALMQKLDWHGDLTIGRDYKGNWQAVFITPYSKFSV